MKKSKKIIKNISFVIFIILIILTLSLVMMSTIAKRNNKMFSLFGYSYSVVVTPSMKPEIEVGEILIIKKLDYNKYLENAQVGEDVVVYRSNTYNNIYIVHKLYEINDEGLILKGVNNPSPDSEIVNESNFHGIVVKHGMQWFGTFLLGSRSLIFFVIVVFILFVMFTEIVPMLIKKERKEKYVSKLDNETKELLREQILKEIEEEKNAKT